MASGRIRSTKRSSSYMPTVTMVLFLAFSFVALWMITSKFITTQQTIHTAKPFISSSHYRFTKSNQPRYHNAIDNIKGDIEDNKPYKPRPQIKANNVKSRDDKQSMLLTDVRTDPITETISTSETDHEEEKQEKDTALFGEEKSEPQETGESVEDEQQSQQQTGESDVEDEQQQENQEVQVREKNNTNKQNLQAGVTAENQQITNSETEETQQTSDEESNENQDEIVEVEEQQTEQDSEVESNNDQDQTQQGTDVDQNQQDTEAESNNIQDQTQQETHEESQETEQEVTKTTNHETQQKHSQPEIQEVVINESQQQRQGFQEIETVTDQQSQQTTTEKETITPVENQKSQREITTMEENPEDINSGESFPGGVRSGIPKESNTTLPAWSTQADQSENQKERRKKEYVSKNRNIYGYVWEMCNVTAGPDFIPCLDNEIALRELHSTKHFEHRERHCPEEGPTCLVPLPVGYKRSIGWPASRDKIWYHNVPHTKLAEVKGHQNWVKMTGEFLTFPGGGTQFIHGALHYIDFIQQSAPNIKWGKRSRVILDVGCGVASFGGYLFERDVLAMSFAPKDEHEAQVQLALERGIPAISAVMGSQRLPFPSGVFDVVHCARCRVPWHAEGGALLLELNRVLRPGGYFVWSATPVYQNLKEDVEIWKAMSSLTISICWDLFAIKKDRLNSIGAAIYHKPISNECYDHRKHNNPPMCKEDDDPNAAWYVPLHSCMHRVPVDVAERGTKWPENWPLRLETPPYWLNSSQMGIYGKPAPDDFAADYEHWKQVVRKQYLSGLGISWSNVRNVMDMRAVYGGFAAALKDLKLWVLNVVNIDSPDTLPIIYERGLFGIYHDWCESFSTYPRTYDLLHADHLFSRLKKRCKIQPVITEVDRIARPGGKLIVCDELGIVGEVENILKSLHWEIHLTFSKDEEGILSAQKSNWRPDKYSASF